MAYFPRLWRTSTAICGDFPRSARLRLETLLQVAGENAG